MSILQQIQAKTKPKLAVLVDPDKSSEDNINHLLKDDILSKIGYFFVGGSHISDGNIEKTIHLLKQQTHIPVVLFPGSVLQIEPEADAMLFLSLISGRNPEYLIGQHVIAAPYIKKHDLETIPTGYMLVEGGKSTTASYMSNTNPLPMDKPELAVSTAIAGELLGMKLIYADAGSGAQKSISTKMIKAIKSNINLPLIVGGGICDPETAKEKIDSGADIIVIGNAIESNPDLISKISNIL